MTCLRGRRSHLERLVMDAAGRDARVAQGDELGMKADALAEVAEGVEAELDRIEAAALAAPFPTQVSIPEFSGEPA